MSKGLLIFILCFVFNIISVKPTPKLPLSPWPSLINSIPRCPAVPALEDLKAAIKDLASRPSTPNLELLERTAIESKDEDCDNNIVELYVEETNGEESRNEVVEEFKGEEINSGKNDDYKKRKGNNKEAETIEESNPCKPVDQSDDRSKEKFEKSEVENNNNDKNKTFIHPLPTLIPIFRKRKPNRPRISTQNINTPSEQKQTNVNSTVIPKQEEKQDLVVQYVKNADSNPVLNIFGSKNAIENSNIRIIPLNSMNGNILTVNTIPSDAVADSQPLNKQNVLNVVPQNIALSNSESSNKPIPLNAVSAKAVHMNTNSENTIPSQVVPIKTVSANAVPINMIPASAISQNTVPENSASISIISTNNFPTNAIPLNIIPSNLFPVSKVPENTIQLNSFPVESDIVNAVPASYFNVNTVSESANPLNTISLSSFPVNEIVMNAIPTNKIPAGTIPIKGVPENSIPKPKNSFPITPFPAKSVSVNVTPASNANPKSSIPSNALPTFINGVPSITYPRIIGPANTLPSDTVPLNNNPSLRNPPNMLSVKSSSNECQNRPDKADLVIFKPENVTLVNVYGDYLKKVTMTVLVPMYVSKVDV